MNDWTCSNCRKVPKVMHSINPNICAACYDASEPGPAPTYNSGDRVTTPDGAGVVLFVALGKDHKSEKANARNSAVCVKLDGKKSKGYNGTLFLAELVQSCPKSKRR
ncbi:MAG: hypothetical protein GY896_22740 [Gammaproteobacteria bacterium]|nr:hypothetical protein [Gammaproteobacteria bacterium]